MTYQFSDTALAARRLSYLAQVFEPTTRSFLSGSAANRSGICLDLGCGIGHTTRLLYEITDSEVIGLDSSEGFLSIATDSAPSQIGFACHDVLKVPFPPGPADTLFCRFLLSHLSNPLTVVNRWVEQLQPGGCLLLEEVERIDVVDALFDDYLAIVAALLASQSQELYIGPILSTARPTSARVVHDRVADLSVPGAQAATMFHMNIQSWKNQDYIRDQYPPDLISDMQENLRTVADEETPAGPAVWSLRQIVISSDLPMSSD